MNVNVDLSIRRLAPDAALEVVAIHRQAFPAEDLTFSIYASKKIRAFVAATMQNSGNWFLGAYLDGTLAGYSHVRAVDDRAHLNYIAVSQASRSQGLGGELIERLLCDARETGFQSISLDAPADDKTLRKWYESKGFRQAAPPKISVLIDPASVRATMSSAVISISKVQWQRFQMFELSEIDVSINSGSFKVGIIGNSLFRFPGKPERELVAAVCDFDKSRKFLANCSQADRSEFDCRILGRSISMELPL